MKECSVTLMNVISLTACGVMAEGGAGSEEGREDDYVRVCGVAELRPTGRKRVTLKGRIVVVFHVDGEVYALDHFCYHTGGPLELGDIEDSHGRLCVVCPWHKHNITLDTGESLYTSINPANPKEKKYNCSKGVKQRVHQVKVEGDGVYLKLSDLSKKVDSDRYFSEEYKKFIEGVLEEPILTKPRPPLRYPIHSSGKDLRRK